MKDVLIIEDIPLPVDAIRHKMAEPPMDIILADNIPLPEEQRSHKMDRGLKKVVERYSAAYQKVYGVLPHIEYNKPWLTVTGHTGRISKQRLLEMARQLEYRAG